MPNKHTCTVDIFKYLILEKNAILKKRRKNIQITLFDKINKILKKIRFDFSIWICFFFSRWRMHSGLTRQGLSCTPTHRISTEETRPTQTLGGCHPRGYREERWGVTETSSHLSTQPQVNFPITENTHPRINQSTIRPKVNFYLYVNYQAASNLSFLRQIIQA